MTESAARVRYVRDLSRVEGLADLPPEARAHLEAVAEKYKFRSNDYYLRLIDWQDPKDPIRRIVIPDAGEAMPGGRLDASNEAANTVEGGVQHKYVQTVLLLVNEICGAYCRYCFRKRLFMDGNDETSMDVEPGCRYVESHPGVTNVLLTGGDPLILGTKRIAQILERLRRIPHVRIVRIGSKMPAFNPFRILDDPELVETLGRHSTGQSRIYLMAHFDHPRELTPEAIEAVDRLIRAGVIVVNQCPLLRGINDDPVVLREMFRTLSVVGAPQYYLFQGRPTAGNLSYRVPIVAGWHVFQEAQRGVSGLAKRARFVMSHETGKIEILVVTEDQILLRYHRAKNPADRGRILVYRRDDDAAWLDELTPIRGGAEGRLAAVATGAQALGPD